MSVFLFYRTNITRVLTKYPSNITTINAVFLGLFIIILILILIIIIKLTSKTKKRSTIKSRYKSNTFY